MPICALWCGMNSCAAESLSPARNKNRLPMWPLKSSLYKPTHLCPWHVYVGYIFIVIHKVGNAWISSVWNWWQIVIHVSWLLLCRAVLLCWFIASLPLCVSGTVCLAPDITKSRRTVAHTFYPVYFDQFKQCDSCVSIINVNTLVAVIV